jgi:hypothetical protein
MTARQIIRLDKRVLQMNIKQRKSIQIRPAKRLKDAVDLKITSSNDHWALKTIIKSFQSMITAQNRETSIIKDTELPRLTTDHDIESHTDLGRRRKPTLTNNLWGEKKVAIWNMDQNMMIFSAITTDTRQMVTFPEIGMKREGSPCMSMKK